MNSFSISAYENQPILDIYKRWLVNDVYKCFSPSDASSPHFIQKLSFLQAEGVRHDIAMLTAVTQNSIQSTGAQMGIRIKNAANLISSSLDDGFALMNNRMLETNRNLESIGQGIGQVNLSVTHSNQLLSGIRGGIAQTNRGIAQLNQGVDAIAIGVNALNNNVSLLSKQIAQAASMIKCQLQQVEDALYQILDELRIPESQRERRYHIEKGIIYFNKGMQTGDCLYFEDALDEFSTAVSIEHKDYFSWYYLGMIYLYSKNNIDLEKAISSFDRYIHYASTLPQRHSQFDEVLLMKAECHYLGGDPEQAYKDIADILTNSIKTTLRGVKYLSCIGKTEDKIQATEIFKQLIEKNPYIVMQVLEDYDIISNDYLMQYINEYRGQLVIELNKIFSNIEKDFEIISRQEEKETVRSIELKMQNLDQLAIMDLLKFREDLLDIKHYITVQKSLGTICSRYEQVVKTIADVKKIVSENENYELDSILDASLRSFRDKIDMINDVVDDETRDKLSFELKIWLEEKSIQLKEDLIEKDFMSIKGKNGLWGFRGSRSCLQIMQPKWKFAMTFQEGLAAVENDESLFGFIDNEGNIAIPCTWSRVGNFSNGLAPVGNSKGEAGFIDKSGKIVIELQFSIAQDFSEGLAAVCNKDVMRGWGYIDKSGNIIIDYHKWLCVKNFHEGMAIVVDEEYHNYVIDKRGNIVFQCSTNYKYVYDFHEGLAKVCHVNGLHGFIDKHGNEVIPCKWKMAQNFYDGLAYVTDNDGKSCRINKYGHIVK